MTPSPGATSCLGNAMTDAKMVCEFLGSEFDEKSFVEDFVPQDIN
jgi:malate dehydrogenase (quinone)